MLRKLCIRSGSSLLSSEKGIFRIKVLAAALSSHPQSLELSTESALLDEKVDISVNGLKQGQKVTLQTFLTESERAYAACGHYVADEDGRVSTFKQPSLGGSFTGLEPMGLFWNLGSKPGERVRRLHKADVTTPYDVTVAVHNGFLDIGDICWSGDFSKYLHRKLKRHYIASGVKRILVEENGIHGALFLPPGNGPFPAIIDIFGFGGGIQEHRASLIASKGFASFALAYVNYKDLSKDGSDLDFGYFLRAFDWLASHPAVNPDAMGCLSSCLGGGYAMFLTSRRPRVKCLVSLNGVGYPAGPTQVVEGEEAVATMYDPTLITIVDGDKAAFKKMSMPENNPPPIYPAWRHGAKILFLTGEDDQCVDPKHKDWVKAATPAEFQKNMTYVYYPGTGHLIEPPYGPLCRYSYNNIFGMYLLWGGQPKPHADAQEDSWKRLVEFFKENLS